MNFTTTERLGVNGSSGLTPIVNVDVDAIEMAIRALDVTNTQILNRFAAALESASSSVAILATHALNMGPAWLLNVDSGLFHQWIAAADGASTVPDLSQTSSWPAYQITTGYNLYLRHLTTMQFHEVSCGLDGTSVVVDLEQTGLSTPVSPYHIINWLYDPVVGLWYRLWAAADGSSTVPELNQTGVTIIA